MTCEHGRPIGGTQIPAGGWFGGIATCRCCSQHFGYIHSSTFGPDGIISSDTQDMTLCKPCGGKVVEYLNPNYERIQVGPRMFTEQRKVSDDQIRELRDSLAPGPDHDMCSFALGEVPCRSCGKHHIEEADCPAFWEHKHRIARCRGMCAERIHAKEAS